MHKSVTGKDLTKEAPRSPRTRLGGYVILARTIDKCRALVAGDIGEYHFDCPLDNRLFAFKGVTGPDFQAQIENGASDQQMAEWLDQSEQKRTPEEVKSWSDETEAVNPYHDPERRDWFVEKVKPLALDPATTTLFDWLETDDKACHAKA